MGFDWVYVNAITAPGESGSTYAVQDYYAYNPSLVSKTAKGDGSADVKRFATRAANAGLGVMVELIINHTARNSVLVDEHPEWYLRDEHGQLVSPGGFDPTDVGHAASRGDLAKINYANPFIHDPVVEYWLALIDHFVSLGIKGFRCDSAYQVPVGIWRRIIREARDKHKGLMFVAETLGCTPEKVQGLMGAGFDFIYNSSKWWDFSESWLLDQYETYRRVAPTISFVETHDTERMAVDLAAQGVEGAGALEERYKSAYLFAAVFSTGVLMPVGYEYGFSNRLHIKDTTPDDWEKPQFDISGYIAEVNKMRAAVPALNEEGPQEILPLRGREFIGLLRRTADGLTGVMTLANPNDHAVDSADPAKILEELGMDAGSIRELTPGADPDAISAWTIDPHGVRVFALDPAPRAEGPAGGFAYIMIEAVEPELDGGLHPIKREMGDTVTVTADIYRDGHDILAAAVRYRFKDHVAWQEVPMVKEEFDDQWEATFPVKFNGRYQYVVEAWTDRFATWRDGVVKKVDAGENVSVELIEGRNLVTEILSKGTTAEQALSEQIDETFEAGEEAERLALMLSEWVMEAVEEVPDREDATWSPNVLEIVVDRPIARYASWYEMFHRSQGNVPGQGANFYDCMARLPEIHDMGFDVVYFVPIHPIGMTHRKGKNNNVTCQPGEPGSPYAIGSDEGGHKDINPELGTLEDFRRFVDSARAHDMEVAIDFAIQCSPDHPWLKEHPEWFNHRPDGTIKYAENPPKKYQDIVNVNFYNENKDALWEELRDIVLFWIEQGVTIFRVDNPHTKPFMFWEWLIRTVKEDHPEIIFLAEAFTRPKMMKKLAKLGYCQSYSYFTWRNYKHEIIDYLEELTQTEVKEYMRPNFFACTPDILPEILQVGGRPAFMFRYVLACTLSSVFGIYNGFELCEGEPVPGKEEYLNSEKYEYKVWDWNRPGNIKEYIKRVNQIRHENPALHELENLRFYPASNDNVLFYGKMTEDFSNNIFIAVNLNPNETHEAVVELPIWEMNIPDHVQYDVEDLLTGERVKWQGRTRHLRLDPNANPVAIYRVTAHV